MKTKIMKLLLICMCLPILLTAQENHLSLANSMAEKGLYEEAIAEINTVIDKDPAYARAYKIRGHIYIAKGDLQKALEDLTQVITLVHNQAKPYVDRAVVHYKMGNKGLAMADITQAQKIAPNDPWTTAVKDQISSE